MSNTDILEAYKRGEITLEQANEELDGIKLNGSGKDGTWTDEEVKAGFIPAVETPDASPDKPDMSRRVDLAGTCVDQQLSYGKVRVFYDEDGYAVKAQRI